MAGRRTLARRASPRRDSGAAAVEGALVTAFVLVPLLLGVLSYGFYFWQAQKVQTMDLEIPQNSLSGIYCSADQLLNRVYGLLGPNVGAIANNLSVPSSAVSLVGSIVESLPGIGVVVRLSLDVDVLDGLLGDLPLVGNVVKELTVRLQDVKIDTSVSC
ncbi:TadE/TadG family type IV pilus assembly protein [Nocardioides abyssi]|uniref:TadE/TadG family type IV pilus assembly protein n=1 Tax=Nocardioides abyssi TaxID=3058370 RepID=A0ABT8ER37_9ACTN|nr:TadE/TadG family type IV pilus assembly protein [Nocardioides abyssi]MDN4160617.1 TadE/TadG family type IV pilus assembly protein [Nocardioides abyssi]